MNTTEVFDGVFLLFGVELWTISLLKKLLKYGRYLKEEYRYYVERIEGALKFGRDWAIPRNADKPVDGRVTTGEYRNWRKKTAD